MGSNSKNGLPPHAWKRGTRARVRVRRGQKNGNRIGGFQFKFSEKSFKKEPRRYQETNNNRGEKREKGKEREKARKY